MTKPEQSNMSMGPKSGLQTGHWPNFRPSMNWPQHESIHMYIYLYRDIYLFPMDPYLKDKTRVFKEIQENMFMT